MIQVLTILSLVRWDPSAKQKGELEMLWWKHFLDWQGKQTRNTGGRDGGGVGNAAAISAALAMAQLTLRTSEDGVSAGRAAAAAAAVPTDMEA